MRFGKEMNVDRVREAIETCNSVNEVLEYLGFKKNNSTQRFKLLKEIQQHQIDISHFGSSVKIPSTSRWANAATIQKAAQQASNMEDFLVQMGLSSKGSNRDTATKHLTRLHIDTNHWQVNPMKGIEKYQNTICIPLNEILEGQHPSYKTFLLKNRLIKDGIKENKCECCGLSEWNNKPLAIQLDHINGISNDHRLENLRMLCPNCHSQTETYAGKNRVIV